CQKCSGGVRGAVFFSSRRRHTVSKRDWSSDVCSSDLVVAHVFGERTLATLERLLSLLSAFEVVVWMTDGWPLYESRLKGKLHVISKRYTQRIERHNLNLRQHLARLGRKSLSFSKSVELHDKVIGHYLNIKHYQ